jgi:hypothetical protein
MTPDGLFHLSDQSSGFTMWQPVQWAAVSDADLAGLMFWFMRKKFVGSYLAFRKPAGHIRP